MRSTQSFFFRGQILRRNGDVNVFTTFIVGFGYVNFFEIMHSYFEISSEYLNIDNNFFVFCSCKSILILLFRS